MHRACDGSVSCACRAWASGADLLGFDERLQSRNVRLFDVLGVVIVDPVWTGEKSSHLKSGLREGWRDFRLSKVVELHSVSVEELRSEILDLLVIWDHITFRLSVIYGYINSFLCRDMFLS